MRGEKLVQKRWAYTLYRLDDGRVVLSVLCGGPGMYELNIPMDSEATAKAMADQELLEEYANDIRSHPERYAAQSIGM